MSQFATWGYPAWFPRVVGLAETAGGILLVIPRLARSGAAILLLIMAGAAFTHVRAAERPNLLFVVSLATILGAIFRARGPRRGSSN